VVKKEIIEQVTEYTALLKREGITVEKVFIFGSVVRNQDQPDSDIDLAVISPDFGKDRFEERVRLTRLAYQTGFRIDPHPVGLDEFEKEDWKTIIHEIKTTGIEIAA